MYKLLIIDDEKIEREGMAEFIPWETYGIELAGTAWNGQDGYEKVLQIRPDIVLTDIKMPVMDGLTLIRKLKAEFPDIEVIVLSGYGEYEYTSQAMEMGIKYYILKPCDEARILPVLEKVKDEIEKKRRTESRYHKTMKKLMPLAKEQMLRNILLNREPFAGEYDMFLEQIREKGGKICLLGFRNPVSRFDALEQFVIENVLSELYGSENILMATAINRDAVFLLGERDEERIGASVRQIRSEFARINSHAIRVALSDCGDIGRAGTLYTQIKELFQLDGAKEIPEVIHSGNFPGGSEGCTSEFFRYRQLREAGNYGDILFEVYLAFLKMEIRGIGEGRKREIGRLVYRICREDKEESLEEEAGTEEAPAESWALICFLADRIAALNKVQLSEGKDGARMRQILQAVYQNLRNTELSIQYLAKEVLFMNEEHFGRIFARSLNEKFSTWLRKVRIGLVKGILEYAPGMRVSALAELVGYSPDGQYFSKAFRKETGMSLTEYCDWLRGEKRKK